VWRTNSSGQPGFRALVRQTAARCCGANLLRTSAKPTRSCPNPRNGLATTNPGPTGGGAPGRPTIPWPLPLRPVGAAPIYRALPVGPSSRVSSQHHLESIDFKGRSSPLFPRRLVWIRCCIFSPIGTRDSVRWGLGPNEVENGHGHFHPANRSGARAWRSSSRPEGRDAAQSGPRMRVCLHPGPRAVAPRPEWRVSGAWLPGRGRGPTGMDVDFPAEALKAK
jgi:hypothetical protein